MKTIVKHSKNGNIEIEGSFSKCPFCKYGRLFHMEKQTCKICKAIVIKVVFTKAEIGMQKMFVKIEGLFWKKPSKRDPLAISGIDYWITTNI